jgi:hypothetical protein
MLSMLVYEFGPLDWVMTSSLVLVPLVTHVYFGLWVYRDTEARGLANRPFWLTLVLFTGVIGLLIYLFVTPLKGVVNYHMKTNLLMMGAVFNLMPLLLYVWIGALFWNFNVFGSLLVLAGLKLHFDARRLEREVI